MTIVFTGIVGQIIVMTADSVITNDFGDHKEYGADVAKVYRFPGIGCVGAWGERVGNKLGEFLRMENVSPKTHSIDDLAELVFEYLITKYQPHKEGFGDLGYHVAGFDKEQRPRLYHCFWGTDRPPHPLHQAQGYKKYDHSPESPQTAMFLYNGRNDLAEIAVYTLLQEIRKDSEIRFDLSSPFGLARFADFVTRFGAEITPEVGPPFYTHILGPENNIVVIKNLTFCPLNENEIKANLEESGVQWK